MSRIETPVLVIGAGPAGLAAARTLSRFGVACLVVDDNARAGGQYFRQLPASFKVRPDARLARDQQRAEDYLSALSDPLVKYRPGCTVWSMPEPGVFAFAEESSGGRILAEHAIVAAGASDAPRPFPGWTLPGVIAAGGCLNLIKGQAMVPGRRVVVAGNGPLTLVVAYSLRMAGSEVLAVIEAGRPSRHAWSALPGLLRIPKVIGLAAKYRLALLRAGTPFIEGSVVTRAHGSDRLQGVEVSPLDARGQPQQKSQPFDDVDALVIGYGLAPSSEFFRVIGCEMRDDEVLGGLVPVRSGDLETSAGGVYAVGDGAGIGGVEIALLEGSGAAAAIAARRGVDGAAPERDRLFAKLRRAEPFRASLHRTYRLQAPLDLATTETIVCRCEEVTQQQLVTTARSFNGDIELVKFATRFSMGRCQGRNCARTCRAIVASATGAVVPPSAPRMRPPARLIPISALLDEPLLPPREPDQVSL